MVSFYKLLVFIDGICVQSVITFCVISAELAHFISLYTNVMPSGFYLFVYM